MILYLYSKCSTCQKALRYLRDKNVNFSIKEIVLETPSMEELTTMLTFQKGQIKKLFNTSGQLYRSLLLSDKLPQMTQNQALSLLQTDGMLIKRPFLLGNQFGLVGFNETEWSKVFNSNC